MKKRILSLFLVLLITFSFSITSFASVYEGSSLPSYYSYHSLGTYSNGLLSGLEIGVTGYSSNCAYNFYIVSNGSQLGLFVIGYNTTSQKYFNSGVGVQISYNSWYQDYDCYSWSSTYTLNAPYTYLEIQGYNLYADRYYQIMVSCLNSGNPFPRVITQESHIPSSAPNNDNTWWGTFSHNMSVTIKNVIGTLFDASDRFYTMIGWDDYVDNVLLRFGLDDYLITFDSDTSSSGGSSVGHHIKVYDNPQTNTVHIITDNGDDEDTEIPIPQTSTPISLTPIYNSDTIYNEYVDNTYNNQTYIGGNTTVIENYYNGKVGDDVVNNYYYDNGITADLYQCDVTYKTYTGDTISTSNTYIYNYNNGIGDTTNIYDLPLPDIDLDTPSGFLDTVEDFFDDISLSDIVDILKSVIAGFLALFMSCFGILDIFPFWLKTFIQTALIVVCGLALLKVIRMGQNNDE